MSESLFQPCIVVKDDGTITVDFADSYVNTVLDDDETVVYDEPDGQPHSNLLDSLVLGVSTADGLRNLANYIDNREGNL